MPNWCSNTLTLTHADPAMLQRAVAGFNRGGLFQEFVPCPQDLIDTVSGFLGDDEEQRLLEERQKANREKHGYTTWYEFCVARWGVKWDVGGCGGCGPFSAMSLDETTVDFSFDTAWSPPVQFYQALDELGFFVDAFYHEPGMGFCGHYTTDGGDEYHEITGDSDWVEENIPADIDLMFCISSSMAEWDEDEDEYTK